MLFCYSLGCSAPRRAVSLTSFLLRIVLPSLLYLLLPCSFTARLALSGMCDEPVPADWELIPLTWK